ncbi:hypothetical protein ACFONI_14325 [Aeromonas media]|uniref:hypothetical protein n=1 Tax=Aeromonas media TaxID=651 RepID=UPI00361DA583
MPAISCQQHWLLPASHLPVAAVVSLVHGSIGACLLGRSRLPLWSKKGTRRGEVHRLRR